MNFRLFIVILMATLPSKAEAEPRHALLMGVWDYRDPTFPPLPNKGIELDISGMEAKLISLGFEVTVVRNPKLGEAKEAVDEFGEVIRHAKGVSLFYFTGHGSEFEGKNFLIPVGTEIRDNRDLDDEALGAHRVLDRMEASGARVNIMFLDCCRNSMSKAGGNGMAAMEAKGTFIGYATSRERVSQATHEGSLYTLALMQHMATPSLSISDMHTKVTRDVTKRDPAQVPFQYSGLDNIFYFVPAGQESPSTIPDKPAVIMPAVTSAASVKLISDLSSSSALAPMTTRSEGVIKYSASNATDGDLNTAWVEGAYGSGAGEWLQITFTKLVAFRTLRVFAGYGKNADIFAKNSRPSVLQLTTDSAASYKLRFEDVRDWHQFSLPETVNVKSIKLEILETYSGSKYEDTAISEIGF